MFDVSGLTEVKMQKYLGVQSKYYTDSTGTVVAKSCRSCSLVLDRSEFRKGAAVGGLNTICRTCTQSEARDLSSRSENDLQRIQANLYPSGEKICPQCNDSLGLHLFHTNRSTRDGLQVYCISCIKSNKIGRGDNGACRRSADRRKSRTTDEVARDRKILRPYGVKLCSKCGIDKPFSSFYSVRGNPDGLHYRCIECAKLGKSATFGLSLHKYWAEIGAPLECYVCGGPYMHADHVVASRLGGTDDPQNRLPICQPCNSSKWMHPLEEWLRWRHPDIADEVLHRVTVLYGMSI